MVQQQRQQQNDTNGGKQQQQKKTTTTTLTVKVKGQKVDDLKQFLAKKKMERAAKVKSVVQSAENQNQPGVLALWRAQRERLGGTSDLADTTGGTDGAAKGKH